MLKMEFLNIEFLWLLAVIPLLALWYSYTGKHKSNTLNFSNSAAFSESKSFITMIEPILRIFRMIALTLLIIALARPQVTDISTRVKNNQGIDIIMAIDVSASMLAKDLRPNRLEALKDVASSFIKNRTTIISKKALQITCHKEICGRGVVHRTTSNRNVNVYDKR